MTVRSSGAILATACLALSMPAVASADVSSLDAYAGQAAVLGKPHHRHHHRRSGTTVRGGGSRHGAALGARPSRPASGSHLAATGHGSGAAATPGGARSGGSALSANGASASGSGASARGSNSGASAQGAGPGRGGESGIARSVRNAVPAASSSSALTTPDVVVLFAAAFAVLGTALAIRRLSRQPR